MFRALRAFTRVLANLSVGAIDVIVIECHLKLRTRGHRKKYPTRCPNIDEYNCKVIDAVLFIGLPIV